jgi:hypothetical protein
MADQAMFKTRSAIGLTSSGYELTASGIVCPVFFRLSASMSGACERKTMGMARKH